MKTQATTKTSTIKKTSPKGRKPTADTAPATTAPGAAPETQNRMMNAWPPADEIAARAYKIWQQQGCPEGCEEEHWRQAEQEILREGNFAVAP